MARDTKDTAIFTAYEDDSILDPVTPEKNLLRAILVSAMSDIGKNGDSARKATEYFLSPDEEYLFSFQSICAHLDLDPKTILKVVGLQTNESSKASSAPKDSKTEHRTQP